jgi:hypothetical protein
MNREEHSIVRRIMKNQEGHSSAVVIMVTPILRMVTEETGSGEGITIIVATMITR